MKRVLLSVQYHCYKIQYTILPRLDAGPRINAGRHINAGGRGLSLK